MLGTNGLTGIVLKVDRDRVCALLVSICSLLPLSFTPALLYAAPIQFEFFSVDQPGLGFLDPVLGLERRGALRAAGDIWEQTLEARFPGETIQVLAHFTESFPGSFGSGGRATAVIPFDISITNSQGQVFQGQADVQVPLANHLAGQDLFLPGNPIEPSGAEGIVFFDSTLNWWYGIEAPPQGQPDFVTIALHEIGHGLGFGSQLTSDGSYERQIPGLYDVFIVDEAGRQIATLSDADRLAAATDADGLFWSGSQAVAANGGALPRLLTIEGEFLQGVSVSHFADEFFDRSIMASGINLGDERPPFRFIDDLTLGVLQDIGWNIAAPTAVPEPASWVLLTSGLIGFGFLQWRRRRRENRSQFS